MSPSTPSPTPARTTPATLARQARVMLLVLIEMMVSAALGARRLHRRLPAAPSPRGGTFPTLGLAFVLSAALAHAAAGGPLTPHEAVAQPALGVALLLALTPRRAHPVLAIWLCAAAGVQLLWALAATLGAFATVPFRAQFAAVLLWQLLAVVAGLQHRRAIERAR